MATRLRYPLDITILDDIPTLAGDIGSTWVVKWQEDAPDQRQQ